MQSRCTVWDQDFVSARVPKRTPTVQQVNHNIVAVAKQQPRKIVPLSAE